MKTSSILTVAIALLALSAGHARAQSITGIGDTVIAAPTVTPGPGSTSDYYYFGNGNPQHLTDVTVLTTSGQVGQVNGYSFAVAPGGNSGTQFETAAEFVAGGSTANIVTFKSTLANFDIFILVNNSGIYDSDVTLVETSGGSATATLVPAPSPGGTTSAAGGLFTASEDEYLEFSVTGATSSDIFGINAVNGFAPNIGGITFQAITTTGTTYNLAAAVANARVISGGSTTVTSTITNTGTGTADTLNYTGLTTNGTLSGGTLPKSGTALANGNTAASGTATLSVGSTTGNQTITPTVSTATNGTLGGSATLGTTTTATVDVVANRVVTAGSVAFGRVMEGVAVSGTSNLSTTGSDLNNTRVTVGTASADSNGISATGGTNPTYNSASVTDTRTVGGTFTTTGNISSALTLTTTGEGLTGESPINVSVGYTADAVAKRTISNPSVLNLGTLHNGAAVSGTSSYSSTGTNATTTSVSVAAESTAGTINGVTLSSAATSFTGGTSSAVSTTGTFGGNISNSSGGTTAGTFNLAVTTQENSGAGLTGEGSYSNVNLGYTSFVYTGAGVWNTNGGGTWGAVSASPANWTANGGTPGLDSNFTNTDSATFGNVLTSGTANVQLGGDNPNLNAITFNNTNGAHYNIEGTNGGSTGAITLNGSGSAAATITDTAGTHTISAPVTLGTNGVNVNVTSGQQVTIAGQISGSSQLSTVTGTGTTVLSQANTYSGGTSVSAGKLYADGGVAGTSSATGTGAISVASGATFGGSGVVRPTLAAMGITLVSGSTLSSGDAPTGTTAGNGLTLDNRVTQGVILDASAGHVTLTFNLGSGTTGLNGSTASQAPFDYANPNVDSSYMKVLDDGGLDAVGELKFATGDIIALNDLTNGTLQFNQAIPYLLIQADSDADYSGLITTGDINGLTNQDGLVENLTLETFGTNADYAGLQLYLFGGNLEVVPEPNTWALMLGGVALLIFIQQRRRR